MRGEEVTVTTARVVVRQTVFDLWPDESDNKRTVYSSVLFQLCSTLNMATPFGGGYRWTWWCRWTWGLQFPTKATEQLKPFLRYVIWNSAPSRSGSQISAEIFAPWDVFFFFIVVLTPIRPANPGHFKVPYQHRKICDSVSVARDRKK